MQTDVIESLEVCFNKWGEKTEYFILMVTVNFLMPLFSVIIMYGLIVRRVRRSGRRSQRANMQMYERRVTFRVLIVIGTYCICWSPYYICCFLANIKATEGLFEEIYILSIYLGYINSVLNPVIYAFVNDEFQRSLRRAVREFAGSRNERTLTIPATPEKSQRDWWSCWKSPNNLGTETWRSRLQQICFPVTQRLPRSSDTQLPRTIGLAQISNNHLERHDSANKDKSNDKSQSWEESGIGSLKASERSL